MMSTKPRSGIAYGYDLADERDQRGDRIGGGWVINEREAQIIVRIFQDYAIGKSPRAIAVALNAENVASPRSGKKKQIGWLPSTIYGDPKKRTGILNNEAYIGRLVWNRRTFATDPDTGKRVSRANSADEIIVRELPPLRIVPQELWDQVKERQCQTNKARTLTKDTQAFAFCNRRRPRYLLSGLVRCGCCGAAYTAYGTASLKCAGAQDRGTCNNHQRIRRDALETVVLDGLRHHLVTPEMLREFTKTYTAEMNRLRRAHLASAADDEQARVSIKV